MPHKCLEYYLMHFLFSHSFNQRTNWNFKGSERLNLNLNLKYLRIYFASFLSCLYPRTLLGRKKYFYFFMWKNFRTDISMGFVIPTTFSKNFGSQAVGFLQPEVSPVGPRLPVFFCRDPLESLLYRPMKLRFFLSGSNHSHLIYMNCSIICGTFLCKIARKWPRKHSALVSTGECGWYSFRFFHCLAPAKD